MAPKLKAKGDALKLRINENKPAITMIEDGPIVDSPVAIDLGGWHPEKGPQDGLSNMPTLEHKAPCESPCCKHCGRELGDYPTDVPPNNISGL